jgi:hypothetical protein
MSLKTKEHPLSGVPLLDRWVGGVVHNGGVTALAQAHEVSKNQPEVRVSGELEDVVDVNSGRYAIGSDAMLAEVMVTPQCLGSDLAPLSIVTTAGRGATVSVSLFAQLGVIFAIASI